MKQLISTAIILHRTDYGEADRILTVLTPDFGKLSVLAKGVRRVKSKLAGGIELFSVSQITFIKGRGSLDSLVSTRLLRHYGHIVKDLERTMAGYELIKQLDRATEDEPESEYFELLQQAFEALDDAYIPLPLIQLWFSMQLLRIGGHVPNLQHTTGGHKLDQDKTYNFSFEDMAFVPTPRGQFGANHIKFLRLGFAGHPPKALHKIQNIHALIEICMPLVATMRNSYIRV